MSFIKDITANSTTVNEGQTAIFTVTGTNALAGGTPYTLSGVSVADVSGGALKGNVFFDSNGVGTISVTLLNDNLTEGPETLTVTMQGVATNTPNIKSASITINDTSKSGAAVPVVKATAGNDVITNLQVSQSIDGGAGIDTVVYSSNSWDVVISNSGGSVLVNSLIIGDVDTLINVERIKFADTAIALDIDGVGGKAYRVYQAAFNRAPDSGGLGYWIGRMDSGVSLSEVASGFVSSAEFKALYGASPTNAQVVSKFYDNVLHRAPDAGGYSYWLNMLNSGLTVPNALAAFSESPENVSGVSAVIEKGMRYSPDATAITLLSKSITLVGVGGGFDSGNGGGDSGGG